MQAEKTATWPAKACKSVRLTCLTEAGGRGPWTSAAEINILGTAGALPDPKVEGKWTPLIDFPLVPVGAAGLPNNRVCRGALNNCLHWCSTPLITRSRRLYVFG